jgi:hypothetical protein
MAPTVSHHGASYYYECNANSMSRMHGTIITIDVHAMCKYTHAGQFPTHIRVQVRLRMRL